MKTKYWAVLGFAVSISAGVFSLSAMAAANGPLISGLKVVTSEASMMGDMEATSAIRLMHDSAVPVNIFMKETSDGEWTLLKSSDPFYDGHEVYIPVDPQIHSAWFRIASDYSAVVSALSDSGVPVDIETMGADAVVDAALVEEFQYFDTGDGNVALIQKNAVSDAYGTGAPIDATANNHATATPDPGRLKMFWQNFNSGAAQCWILTDDGAIKSYNSILSGGAGDWRIVGSGDVNQDGNTDLIWRHQDNGAVQCWFLAADGYIDSYTNTLAAGLTLGWNLAAVAQIDSDGVPDLIWQKESDAQVQTWFMASDGSIASYTNTLAGGLAVGWAIAAVADINADGVDDLIWQKTSDAAVQTWFMADDGSITSYTNTLAGGLALHWSIVGSGKINADSADDLIWQNQNNAAVQTWFMNTDGSIAGYTNTLAANLATGWSVVGAGDVNNDNVADLLWQNQVNYAVQTWFMAADGSISSYTNTLAAGAASGWNVMAVAY
jgi:hypothetical protein